MYQNEYIEELHEKGAIKHFQADREEYDAKHCIVYLFFSEKREYFLLLGRGESKDFIHEDADDSSCSEHRNHEQDGRMLKGKYQSGVTDLSDMDEIIDSENEQDEEADNDSPYRVKITLDQLFLSYLEDS